MGTDMAAPSKRGATMMVTAMAKRPVAVDGALASAVELGTATRSPVLDLVTMTTLSRDMEHPRRRRDMATAAPLHRRVMALAPVRTGAVADMDRHRAEVLIAAHRMAAHRTVAPLPTAVHPPHHTVHPMERRMGHPTAPLGVATPIPRRTIRLDRVDFHHRP